MIRLRDIAQRAGVSIMTVSKALRDAPDISEGTKARLRLLAAQMGYVPDAMARGLRTRTTMLLGVVIPAITNPIFTRIVMAIEEKAYEAGYELILAQSMNRVEQEEAILRRLLARRVDGLLVSPVYRMESPVPIYDELRQRGTPTVIIGSTAPFCQGYVSVQSDDLEASYLLTKHFLGLGHKRIAFFTGPSVAPWAQERLDGYRRALREAELPLDHHLIFNAGSTIEEGEKAALQMLAESPQATAIQAVNDMVAIGAGNALLNRGLRIPQDFSLAGFGNILASEYFRVPLTTVRQPKLRLGAAATEILLQLMRGEHPASKRLPAELIIRASTAAPSAA
jgi:LacI family transcriptional regulator